MTPDNRWKQVEPIRVRIMMEAYNCADRDEVEAYNSIKVMCSEVLKMVTQLIEAEREACCAIVFGQCSSDNVAQRTVDAIRARSKE